MKPFSATGLAVLAAAAWAHPLGVRAQPAPAEYPLKTVRTVVSYAPGGATDIMARIVAHNLTESLGKSFVVDNQSGAGGVIGDALVARAAPDGYTLLATSSTFAINPAVVPKLPFDAVKGFVAPVITVGTDVHGKLKQTGIPRMLRKYVKDYKAKTH